MSEQAKRRAKSSGGSRITATNPRGLPTVAIVGRPNVGKSTLLNRIVGRREAIVEERPGVTRDRKDVEAEWSGVPFLVIDTGGWMEGGNTLDEKVSRQAERAIEDADLVLFVTDVTVGATPEDESVADILRRRRPKGSTFVIANKVDGETREPDIWAFAGLGLGDPFPVSALHGRGTGDFLDAVIGVLPVAEVPEDPRDTEFDHVQAVDRMTFETTGVGGGKVPAVVIANKVDGETREPDIWAFSGLGLGDPFPVSALHGRGTGDFLDAVIAVLPKAEVAQDPEDSDFDHEQAVDRMTFETTGVGGGKVPAVVIAGRPNVGKSTLFNRLIGDERSIVHDMAGTTRDAIDTVVQTDEGEIRFIDTAGMRRKSKIDEGAEYFSLVRALQAIDGADAALLVLDATEGVTHQDQRLAERIDAAGCPIVVLLNKWDLLDNEGRGEATYSIEDRLAFLSYAPVLKISARSGLGMHKLMPALAEAITKYHMRVPTRELNQLIQEAVQAHPSREARILYATQGATDPPTFTVFANRELSPQYMRFIERRIRERFNFGATPLKLRVRKRGG